MKWYYIDKDGNRKLFFGKTAERDGKFYGILTESKNIKERREVYKVADKEEIESVDTVYKWKDLSGNEHIYDEQTDGKFFTGKDGKLYINKMLETKINLIYHEGED